MLVNNYAKQLLQMQMVKAFYPTFCTKIFESGLLIVTGNIKDDDYESEYGFEVVSTEDNIFFARISHPFIPPNADMHIGKNGLLCLFHPGLYSITKRFSLSHEIIPMVIKWCLFYETAKINGGIFIEKSIPHGIRFNFNM